jgi:hypothetical protein
MFRAAVLILAGATVAGAHDFITTKITWSKEMSRVIYKRCATCHRPGGSAFSLLTYEEARPWAKAIKEEVLERRMPPWQAVKGFGEFKDDRGLTQEDLEIISDWVEGGAPEGNPKYVPEVPKADKWLDPAVPRGSAEIVVSSNTKLEAPARVLAVRAKDMKKGESIQVIAARPDGTLAPLLWIYQYNPGFQRTYYLKSPVSLPAGTQIETSPPGAGSLALFTAPTPKAIHHTRGAGLEKSMK